MADTIFTSETPATDDTSSSLQNLGMRFQVSASGKAAVGGRVWIPATGLATGCVWQLWDTTSPLSPIATFNLDSATGTSAWFPFAISPVNLTASRDYVVAIHHPSGSHHYMYTSGGSLPVGTGVVSADTGRYSENVDVIPGISFSGYFFADVSVDVPTTTVNVGTAAEVDSAKTVVVDQATAVGKANEVDSAFSVLASLTVPVGLSSEVDSAFSVGTLGDQVVAVGKANEIDSALSVKINLTVPVGKANERDSAFPVGHTGGAGLVADATLSTVYLLNLLAGTIVNGVPSLSGPDAAAHWVATTSDRTVINAFNIKAGNTLPNYEALRGVLNHIAGTYGLSVHDALLVIVGAS